MIKKIFPILCLLSITDMATFAQGNKVDSSKMTTLHIDPKSARGGKVSEVFEEVSFTPLETTKESLFGTISKIEIVDDCYVIYDIDTRSVLVFTSQGKFRSRINAPKIIQGDGQLSGDYLQYSIKKDPGKSLIRIFTMKYQFYFDLDGKQVKKVASKDDTSDWGLRFSDGTEIAQDRPGDDGVYYGLLLLKDFKQVAAFLPYSTERFKDNSKDYFTSSVNPVSDSRIPDEMFYTNTFDYNIYTVTPKSLYLSYRMLLPSENSFPVDFKSNTTYSGKRKDYFNQQPNRISEIKNVFKIGNNLFFKIYTLNGNQMRNSLIHNFKTGMLTSIKDLEPDQSSMFLPVTDMGGFNDFDNRGFQLYDGNYLYTSISALAMFTFRDQSAAKKPNYTAALESYFKTQDRKSNPVIVKLKPKKD